MQIDLLNTGKQFYGGKMLDAEKTGITAIVNSATSSGITQINQVAYILGTAYHESAGKMQGIDEFGKGRKHEYGQVDPEYGKIYYGRGIVQLTWKDNYRHFSNLVGCDLVKNPELANRLDIAVKILIVGMKKGMFTGVGLDRFIVPGHCDFINARKIINSLDQADRIARFAVEFSHLLSL